MLPRRSSTLVLLTALSLATGCPGKSPVAVKHPTPTKAPATIDTAAVHYAKLTEAPMGVPQVGEPSLLTGKVKLISDHGSGVISNNSGNLIANNAGNIISEHGGAIIANNGGGLTGKTKRVLLQAADEALLADAQVEVIDAEGHVMADDKGNLLTAKSDQTGAYSLKAVLPAKNLLLRVRLFNGGQLTCVLPKQAGDVALDLNTASSLGATYVMTEYVKGKQTVFDRLPKAEAAALTRDMEAARALAGKLTAYQPDELVKAASDLRAKAPAVKQTLDRIEALLLIGQANLGAGRLATEVALSTPVDVLDDGTGTPIVVENALGRLRRLVTGADGQRRLELIAGAGALTGTEAMQTSFTTIHYAIRGKDGSYFVSEGALFRVRRIWPDGHVTAVAGNGNQEQGAAGGKAAETPIMEPCGLAFAPDGSLYISESGRSDIGAGRLLRVDPDGILHAESVPEVGMGVGNNLVGLAIAPDGTIFVASAPSGFVAMKAPGGAWKTLGTGLIFSRSYSHLVVDGDGVLASDTQNHKIVRFGRDGSSKVIAGTGIAGTGGDGGPADAAQLSLPGGMWRAPDGSLYVADTGNGLVRLIGVDGTITTVAGAQGLSQQGDAQALAINGPGGITFDPQGRLVISETISHLIKRLDGSKLSVIAGTSVGWDGDGGPATAARLNQPGGMAYKDGELWFAEPGNKDVRKIAVDGTISTVAGHGPNHFLTTILPAKEVDFGKPFAGAFDLQGRFCFTDNIQHQVDRINLDGTVERLTGSDAGTQGATGDGGPSRNALVSAPTGIAFDKAGNLYFVDSGNLAIRKISPDGIISHVAGTGRDASLAAILSGNVDQDKGKPAEETFMALPAGICFDDQGRLYVAEVGSANFQGLSAFKGVSLEGLPKINARIRRIDLDKPGHPVTQIAGPGTQLLADPAGDNALRVPLTLAIDPQGRMIIADGGSNQILVLPKGSF
ncbi:MAG: repeat containing protein [Cyanobacteria bacterium RYN_339]|nr:repeat containing protein [Cyanobacteria bacterium RYN_339]